jgi:hypothetical protein
MELPDDIIKHIKEYAQPYFRNWRRGSYIHQYYKTLQTYKYNSLREDLQIFIVKKWFSYDRIVHLKLEYKLIQKSIKFRDLQYGAGKAFGIRKWRIKEDIEETLALTLYDGISRYKDPEKRREQLQWREE